MRPPLKSLLRFFLTISFAFYVGAMAYMFYNQNNLLFEVSLANSREPTPYPDQLFTQITTATTDGTTLHGVQSKTFDPQADTLVFFSGNAQNVTDFAVFLNTALPAVNLVGFYYRGYGNSKGSPTTKTIMEDTHPIYTWVKQHTTGKIFSLGLSIGTGPATRFATYPGIAGLILAMPYRNLAAVGAGVYPWLPVNYLFKDNINTSQIISAVTAPVAIVTAGEDTLIPPAVHAKEVANHVHNLVAYGTLEGKTHSSLINSAEFGAWLNKTWPKLSQSK